MNGLASGLAELRTLTPDEIVATGLECVALRNPPKKRRASKPFKGTKDQLIQAIFGGRG